MVADKFWRAGESNLFDLFFKIHHHGISHPLTSGLLQPPLLLLLCEVFLPSCQEVFVKFFKFIILSWHPGKLLSESSGDVWCGAIDCH